MIKIRGAAQSAPCVLKTRNTTMLQDGSTFQQFFLNHFQNVFFIAYIKILIGSVESKKGKENNFKKDLDIGFPFSKGLFTNE